MAFPFCYTIRNDWRKVMRITLRRNTPITRPATEVLTMNEADTEEPVESVFGTTYKRKGITVRRLKMARPDRMSKFQTVLVPPKQNWYPSTTANFIFGFNDKPSHWFVQLVPSYFNPSLWASIRHRGCPVLRVPKDRMMETWEILYEKGLWYNGTKNKWYRRQRPVHEP